MSRQDLKVCAKDDKCYFFVTAWQLPKDYMTTAWQIVHEIVPKTFHEIFRETVPEIVLDFFPKNTK
jgi:hypothetical protein